MAGLTPTRHEPNIVAPNLDPQCSACGDLKRTPNSSKTPDNGTDFETDLSCPTYICDLLKFKIRLFLLFNTPYEEGEGVVEQVNNLYRGGGGPSTMA